MKIATIEAADTERIGSVGHADRQQVATHLRHILAGVIA